MTAQKGIPNMSKAKIPSEEEYEIVAHIRDAKDKRKQLQIEADLHCISVTQVKAILKEHGFNLRQLNGADLMKKSGISVGIGDDNKGEAWTPAVDEKSEQVETEAEQAKQWAEIAIPPVENIITDVQNIPRKEIKYKKPEIIKPPASKPTHLQGRADLEAIHQYIIDLLKEKKMHQSRTIEINAELLLYRDFCKSIFKDIEEGELER